MISRLANIEDFIHELSDAMGSDLSVDIYLIGGGAMMYMGGKAATKDMDLVVIGEDAYDTVRRSMLGMGFRSIRPGAEYARMNLSDMLERGDGMRVDLFDTRVCRRLELSGPMRSRAVLRHSCGGVRLFSCSGNDVLIFKSITSRDGDIEDCMSLIEGGEIDWKTCMSEIELQISDGEEVWNTWIAERLSLLSERGGVRIPILAEVNRMADEYMERWERELLDSAGVDARDLPDRRPYCDGHFLSLGYIS